jgi:hypothetical protein
MNVKLNKRLVQIMHVVINRAPSIERGKITCGALLITCQTFVALS